MRNTPGLVTSLFAALTICACAADEASDAADPSETGSDGQGDVTDPPPSDPPANCTPSTDVVPLGELADYLETSAGIVTGDAVRAGDGTIYFISEVEADQSGATISRREPCKAIELDWMTVSAPIVDLEISADNQLYMAGSGWGFADNVVERLYRLDLTDPNAFPQNLVREPGQVISSMSAAPDGRLFFIDGPVGSERSLRYVDGDDIVTVSELPFSTTDAMSVAALSDGKIVTSGRVYNPTTLAGSNALVRFVLSSNGDVTPSSITTQQRFVRMYGDSTGGVYGVAYSGLTSSERDWMIFHAPYVGAAWTEVARETSKPAMFSVSFGIVGDSTAVMFMPKATTQPFRSVALPAPLMTML